MFDIETYNNYHHLIISVGLGLLIGLQREWAESPVAGIRSFTLISLLGTVCAILAQTIGESVIILGFISVLGITLLSRAKLHITHNYRGLVTETSLVLMYFIGIMIKTGPILLAAALTVTIAFILQVKIELHSLATRFNEKELRSFMQFMAITLVIFPIVPNISFGPMNSINLQNIWLMLILITGISLSGHIIYKIKKDSSGILLGGILGGIISSTATTLSYSKNLKKSVLFASYYSLVILVAWTTLYARVFIELKIVAPDFKITVPLLFLSFVSLMSIFWSWKKTSNEISKIDLIYSPTGLITAITFILFYTFIMYVFSYLKDQVDRQTFSAIAFISGIFDVDAITLSTGRLIKKGILSQREGLSNIFTAIFANVLFKGLLTLVIGGKKLFKLILPTWVISLITIILIIVYKNYLI